VVEDHLEERGQVGTRYGRVEAGGASPGVGVDDREVDLVLGGVEVEEEFVGLVHHLGQAGVGAVDLVDDQHDGQAGLQRLAEHEAGLWAGSLGRVDEQDDPVDHVQRPFNLAAEVGVARRIDDVDLDPVADHGGVLGQDGDALLTLQVHGVHDPLGDLLVVAESTRLAEQGIDEGGLAVVDVRDDGHVPQVGTGAGARGVEGRGGGHDARLRPNRRPNAEV